MVKSEIKNNIGILNLNGNVVYSDYSKEEDLNLKELRIEFEKLISNPNIAKLNILLNTNGGGLNMLSETVEYLNELKDKYSKPVIMYGNGMVASAGYWLSLISDEFYISDTTEVGSIGVRVDYVDDKEGLEKLFGIKITTFTNSKSKNKVFDIKNDEKVKSLVSKLDYIYNIFIDKIQKIRGLGKEDIDNLKGDTFIGEEAVKLKLADGVKNYLKESNMGIELSNEKQSISNNDYNKEMIKEDIENKKLKEYEELKLRMDIQTKTMGKILSKMEEIEKENKELKENKKSSIDRQNDNIASSLGMNVFGIQEENNIKIEDNMDKNQEKLSNEYKLLMKDFKNNNPFELTEEEIRKLDTRDKMEEAISIADEKYKMDRR